MRAMAVSHLLDADALHAEWPRLRARVPSLPQLPPPTPGAELQLNARATGRPAWCDQLAGADMDALQRAVYAHYRDDFELLRFHYPLPLDQICPSLGPSGT